MKHELDKVSFEVVHIVPEIAARLNLRVTVLLVVLTSYKVDERRLTEIADACSRRIVILQPQTDNFRRQGKHCIPFLKWDTIPFSLSN